MEPPRHTTLFVDDEKNILNSLKRLLRKEDYRLLTASSGEEGLKILAENEVHLVITDLRMPKMNGIEFLTRLRVDYPDLIRIILTGYTDVDTLIESINKGHIYKFFLKPWDDHDLKMEIRKTLEQYDLMAANKRLYEKAMKQNEESKAIDKNLEDMVQKRTKELEIQNHALQLSHAILEDLPIPIVGVSAEGIIVLINHYAQKYLGKSRPILIGNTILDCFSDEVNKMMTEALASRTTQTIEEYRLSEGACDIDLIPLSGRFSGKGVIIVLKLH